MTEGFANLNRCSPLPTTSPQTFTPFPRLPTELRLKIWKHVHEVTPPQVINFCLCSSDLDYLRLNRKACHNYYHVCARKMKRIPSMLHTSIEARTVALEYLTLGSFDNYRLLSLGRDDTDVDTYTTCSHEVSVNEQEGRERGIYWDPRKDVVYLAHAPNEPVDPKSAAYIWGGSTGINFGKMRRVAMSLTLAESGLGQGIDWESIDMLLLLFSSEYGPEDLETSSGHWTWLGVKMNAEDWTRRFLESRGLLSSSGSSVELKFFFGSIELAMEYVAKELDVTD